MILIGIKKKIVKNYFLCHKIAWIRIRIRSQIRIRILQKGLDPDPYNKHTDPQHCIYDTPLPPLPADPILVGNFRTLLTQLTSLSSSTETTGTGFSSEQVFERFKSQVSFLGRLQLAKSWRTACFHCVYVITHKLVLYTNIKHNKICNSNTSIPI